MSTLLFLHLIAIGIWAGCVATEVVLEIAQKNLPPGESYLAPLHAKIDIAVEIPAITLTLFTGAALLGQASWDALLVAKVGFGLSAVALRTCSKSRELEPGKAKSGEEAQFTSCK